MTALNLNKMKAIEDNTQKFLMTMFNFMSAMKKNTSECCEMCGNINEKELLILNFVAQNDKVKMRDIADYLEVPLSTLTSMVDKLIDRNYLSRHHSTDDRRVILVSPGSVGIEVFRLFISKKQELATNILSKFNQEEQNTFIQFLQRASFAMDKKN